MTCCKKKANKIKVLIKKRRHFLLVVLLYFTHAFFGLPLLQAQIVSGDSTIQAVSNSSVNAPFVYLDCRRCDYDFIRTELTFVNYVRDPELADIHVFVTDERTSGGGSEYQFSFIGRRDFAGTNYTLKHYIDKNATIAEQREALKNYLKMGLVSFVLQTPLGTRFSIKYDDNGEDGTVNEIYDPWDFWVFQAYVGSVELEMESNKTELDSRWGFFADRVTENWKFRFRPYFNYDRVKIQTPEREVFSKQRRHGLDLHAIKSLTDHWSAGLFGTYLTYNGRNIRHEIMVNPGIEYSIYPYEMATRKSITFTYQVGYGYYNYFEETIYNKTSENLFKHDFEGVVNILQPWGSIETGLEASQYLKDPKLFRIEFFGRTSVRLFEGFSLSIQASYDVVRDQLSLPKGEASLEEVLLRQRELATDYSFSSSIAISYTFGSKFTNIVNTRF